MKYSILIIYITLIYYISCVKWVSKEAGCNDDGDGTEQIPFCSLNQALKKLDQDGIVKIQNGEYHEDIVIPNVPKLSLIGYGSFMPTFHSIKTTPGQSLNLTIEFIHFKSKDTQIDLKESHIESLNMKWVIVTKTENSKGHSVIINDANTINITDSHFTNEATNSSEIQIFSSRDHYYYKLYISNCSFSVDQLSIQNSLSGIIENSLINTNKLILHGKEILVDQSILHVNKQFKIYDFIKAEVRNNRLLDTEISIDSDTNNGNKSDFICHSNIFESNSRIIFEEKDNLSKNHRFQIVTHNTFPKTNNYVILNKQLETSLNAHSNYYGSDDGPTICSNPWGDGGRVSLRVDYSDFCLTDSCNVTTEKPILLNSTLFYDCGYYKKGTYASLIIFTIIYIVLGFGALSIYYRRITTNKDNDIKDKIRSHSLLSMTLSLLQIPFPITAKIISLSCVTLTPAYDCVFTINDSALASLMIYTYSIIILTSLSLTFLIRTSYITRYSLYSVILIIKLILSVIPFITIIYIIICIVYYISSIVMSLGITLSVLCLVTEIPLLIKLFKFKEEIKPLKIDITDYDSKHLLDTESDTQVNEEGVNNEENISYISMSQFTTYYKKFLIANAVIQIIFFSFSIWLTKINKPAGIMTLLNWSIIQINFIIGALMIYKKKGNLSGHMIYSFLSIISIGFTSLLYLYYFIDILLFITSHIVLYIIAYLSLFILLSTMINFEFSWTYRKSIFKDNRNNHKEEIDE